MNDVKYDSYKVTSSIWLLDFSLITLLIFNSVNNGSNSFEGLLLVFYSGNNRGNSFEDSGSDLEYLDFINSTDLLVIVVLS